MIEVIKQTPEFSVRLLMPSFDVDTIDLSKWLKNNFNTFLGLNKVGSIVTASFSEPLATESVSSIQAHVASLTETGEQEKIALPSRKVGPEMTAFLNTKKVACASKTWDEMTAAERKLVMSAPMTEAEIDSL